MIKRFSNALLGLFKQFWFSTIIPWLRGLTPKRVFRMLLVAGMAFLLLVVSLFVIFSFSLPTVESLKDYKPSAGTQILSDDGRVLGHIRIEKGAHVPLNRIPKFMKDALLATEDPRFYQHKGIDYRGILRAAFKDIFSLRLKQGGSTITQQLAKVVFLSPERKFTRKIKEVILARRLEAELSKDEILELYLNKIYFGHGAYGVQTAARTYFGKSVWDINKAEAALLAGLPQSPMGYSPYSDIDLTKMRQAQVLKRMVDEEYITEQQSSQIYAMPLVLENLRAREEIAPYVVDYVHKYIERKYGPEQLYHGGLKVYTAIDVETQRAAHNALHEGLRALDKRQGFRGKIGFKKIKQTAAQPGSLHVVVKPGEGYNAQVLSVADNEVIVRGRGIIGSISAEDMTWALIKKRKKGEAQEQLRKPKDILQPGDLIHVRLKSYDGKKQRAVFSLDQTPLVEGAVVSIEPYTGYVRAMVGGYDYVEGGFNHALDAKRQPGSSFKPFIYGAALESGYTPATIVMDVPIVYENAKKDWKPGNYDQKFLGPLRLRTALALSRNAVTVGLIDKIGLNKTIDFATAAGITSPISRDFTTALGSSVMSPIEMTSAYATFASQGVRAEPIIIQSIVDASGKTLESYEPQPKDAINPATAYLLTSLLRSVVEDGTAKAAKWLGSAVVGKTGTTNRFVDAWFVGYSPSLVTGVWVGYDNPKASLGEKETGARAALPIWMSVMAQSVAVHPGEEFPQPPDVVSVKIDPDTGLLARPDQADAIIEVFRRGTEPTQVAEKKASQGQFYNLDQGIEETTKRTLPEDEVDD